MVPRTLGFSYQSVNVEMRPEIVNKGLVVDGKLVLVPKVDLNSVQIAGLYSQGANTTIRRLTQSDFAGSCCAAQRHVDSSRPHHAVGAWSMLSIRRNAATDWYRRRPSSARAGVCAGGVHQIASTVCCRGCSGNATVSKTSGVAASTMNASSSRTAARSFVASAGLSSGLRTRLLQLVCWQLRS